MTLVRDVGMMAREFEEVGLWGVAAGGESFLSGTNTAG